MPILTKCKGENAPSFVYIDKLFFYGKSFMYMFLYLYPHACNSFFPLNVMQK